MGILVQEAQRDGAAHEPHTTIWRSVQSGIWVGHRGGAFAGMIEQRWGEGFLVTTRLGKSLGAFGTMPEAQRALR
jgi:hypothetical protein